GGNGEGHVQWSVAVVRGNRAARHAHRLERGAAAKQQQYALAADIVGAKPRVAGQLGESQYLLVEARRTVEIVDVETGLDHALELHASPHIEHGPRFVRHAARIPGRVPYDIDLHLTHARDARDRVLHHGRQLLCGGTI